jgi:peroxiredoxin family protein
LPAPAKLSIVVHSGEAGRVRYALMMGAAAVSIGKAVTLFFTMEAIHSLALPFTDPRDEEMIQALASLGAKFMVCEAGLIETRLTLSELRDDLAIEETGLVTFLADCAPDGQIVFV